jgi:hypothetical protein
MLLLIEKGLERDTPQRSGTDTSGFCNQQATFWSTLAVVGGSSRLRHRTNSPRPCQWRQYYPDFHDIQFVSSFGNQSYMKSGGSLSFSLGSPDCRASDHTPNQNPVWSSQGQKLSVWYDILKEQNPQISSYISYLQRKSATPWSQLARLDPSPVHTLWCCFHSQEFSQLDQSHTLCSHEED